MNGISQSAASQHVQELETRSGSRAAGPFHAASGGDAGRASVRRVLPRHSAPQGRIRSRRSQRMKQEVEGTVRVAVDLFGGLERDGAARAGVRAAPARGPAGSASICGPRRSMQPCWRTKPTWAWSVIPKTSREITVIPWRQEEMVLAASPDHPLAARADAIAPARAQRRRLHRLSTTNCPSAATWTASCKEHGVEVNVALALRQPADDQGSGRASRRRQHHAGAHHARRDRAGPLGRGAHRRCRTLFRPLGIIHRKKKRFHRVAQAFLDLLREGSGPEAAAV